MAEWTLYEGDCLEVMRQLPDNSVDAVAASPPYAMQRAKLYGGVPEDEYPAWTRSAVKVVMLWLVHFPGRVFIPAARL